MFGAKPTIYSYTCKSTAAGSAETCSVTAPAAGGTYYVRARPIAGRVLNAASARKTRPYRNDGRATPRDGDRVAEVDQGMDLRQSVILLEAA